VPDLEMVRQALSLLADPAAGVQLTCMPSWAWGTFPGAGEGIDQAAEWVGGHGDAQGIYYALNPVSVGLEARCKNSDALRRRWLLIDVDRVKTAEDRDLSASAKEHADALGLAEEVREHLHGLGWPDPGFHLNSGNGAHLLYRIDWPNDPESQKVLSAFLKGLAAQFDGPRGELDRAVHDARRISKLPGTWARKGPSTTDRPHRMARVLSSDAEAVAVPLDLVRQSTPAKAAGEKAEAAPVRVERSPWVLVPAAVEESAELAWARQALASECNRMRSARPGSLNTQLYKSGAAMGNIVASGLLGREEVTEAILEAGAEAGCDNPKKDRATVERGIDEGMKTPRKPDPATKNAQPTKQTKQAARAANGPAAAARYRHPVAAEAMARAAGLDSRLVPVTTSLPTVMNSTYPEPRYAVQGIVSEGLNILVGKPKLGKAQPLSAPVLTPHGWRKMGDIRPGDMVIGVDGRPTEVVAVHPQGVVPIYRVTASDGVQVEATGDHLWQVTSHNDRTTGRPGRVMSTAEVARSLREGKERFSYLPVLAGPVEFARPDGPLPLDPYLLGVLIGDGGLTKDVTFTTGDVEMFGLVEAAMPAGCRLHVLPSGRTANVSGAARGKPNPAREALSAVGLMGKKSPEKFIPEAYLLAAPEDRFALLQGLLDTDGGMDGGGRRIVTFSTSSRRLADGVRHLIEALGGTARTKARQTFHSRPGDPARKAGLPSYRIIVRLPASLGCPFRLARKAAQWRAVKTEKNCPVVRRITAVEPAGSAPAQCITVAAADGLYLTAGCVVTHNSWLALNLGITIAAGGVALGGVPVATGPVLYLALEDRLRRLQSRSKMVLGGLVMDPPDDLDVSVEWPRLDAGGLDHICEWIEGKGITGEGDDRAAAAKLIIIDVWAKFRPVEQNSRASAYDTDYAHMAALKGVLDHYGTSALILHHTRKAAAADAMDEVSGTAGIAGAADGVLVLTRTRHQEPQNGEMEAELLVMPRDHEEQKLALAVDQKTWVWTSQGKTSERSEGKLGAAIMKVMEANAGLTISTRTIMDAIQMDPKPSMDSLRKVLSRLVERDVLSRPRDGHYRRPLTETPF